MSHVRLLSTMLQAHQAAPCRHGPGSSPQAACGCTTATCRACWLQLEAQKASSGTSLAAAAAAGVAAVATAPRKAVAAAGWAAAQTHRQIHSGWTAPHQTEVASRSWAAAAAACGVEWSIACHPTPLQQQQQE